MGTSTSSTRPGVFSRKQSVRKKLRGIVGAFRPLKRLEIGSLVFLFLFSAYYGSRNFGWLAPMPACVAHGEWQYHLCVLVAIIHVFNMATRSLIRRNFLREDLHQLVDFLDELHGGWGVDESVRQDSQLIRQAIDYTEPALFSGDYATLWSASVAMALLIMSLFGMATN